MIERPRIKEFLTVYPLSETRWVFRGGSNEICRVDLRNERARRTFHTMLPLLDGGLPTAEVLERLERDGIDRGAAAALLGHLERSRCIEEAGDAANAEDRERFASQLTFFSHFTTAGGARFQALLADKRVATIGAGGLIGILDRQLAAAGVGERVTLEPGAISGSAGARSEGAAANGHGGWFEERHGRLPDLVVAVSALADRRLFHALDRFSRGRGVPWLQILLLSVQEAWIGPLFVPGESASYGSYAAALRAEVPHFPRHPAVDRLRCAPHASAEPPSALPAALRVIAGIAATEIVKLLTGYQVPHLLSRYLAVDLLTWETESHEVWRMPRHDRTEPDRPQPFPWKEALYGQSSTHQRRG